jgi:site-specific recombinase XerD
MAGGADLQIVEERLGHASITTTERYLKSRELHQAGDKPQGAS